MPSSCFYVFASFDRYRRCATVSTVKYKNAPSMAKQTLNLNNHWPIRYFFYWPPQKGNVNQQQTIERKSGDFCLLKPVQFQTDKLMCTFELVKNNTGAISKKTRNDNHQLLLQSQKHVNTITGSFLARLFLSKKLYSSLGNLFGGEIYWKLIFV